MISFLRMTFLGGKDRTQHLRCSQYCIRKSLSIVIEAVYLTSQLTQLFGEGTGQLSPVISKFLNSIGNFNVDDPAIEADNE